MAARLQKVFAALCAVDECVPLAALAKRTRLPRREVSYSVSRLITRGVVERERLGCYRASKAGRAMHARGETIKQGPAGKHNGRCRAPRNTLRVRIWRALRAKQKATLPDLVQLAGSGNEKAAIDNARHYLNTLIAAGYVRRLTRREPGVAPTSNGFHKYLLIRNTGPKAPVHQPALDCLYDPNLDEEIDLGGES